MAKDVRYNAVKSLLETGNIKSFADIFIYIPKKVVYTDMGITYAKFHSMVTDPAKFKLGELIMLSRFIGVEPLTLVTLAYQATLKKGKK